MYPHITKLIFDEWQEVWNCCAGNKLHAIKPTVGGYKQKTFLSHRDSVLLNILRIGHTCLMHSYLLSGQVIYLLHHTNYNLLRMFYSSLTALIIHPFYISFLFLHKTLMARNGLLCADVPLTNYSINQSGDDIPECDTCKSH